MRKFNLPLQSLQRKSIRSRWSGLFLPVLGAVTLMATLTATPVSAGIFDDSEARKAILDLRTKVDTVSAQLEARLNSKLENKAENGSVLELSGQIEQLRGDIARLRGQLEVLTNDLSNTQRRQQDLYVDLDNRLRKLEPQKVTVDGKEATVENNEQRSYEAALALFKAGNYKDASTGFSNFTATFPQSVFVGPAQYWLGNAYYAQRDCKNAIPAFSHLVKNYPDHPKAPDSLLVISACQSELKDKVGSRKTLEKIITQYPGSEEAKAAKARLSSSK